MSRGCSKRSTYAVQNPQNNDLAAYAAAERQLLQDRKKEVYPKMWTYFDYFKWAPNDERGRYKLAGAIIKRCNSEPEVALAFLHKRRNDLIQLSSLEAFYRYINDKKNSPLRDPATMGELESEAFKQ